MAANKAALKAAKAALDSQNYGDAVTQSLVVLSSDPQNYFAKLFLGRALDKLGKPDDAAKAYYDATKIRPQDDQAWLGLRALFESRGPKSVDEYVTVSSRLADLYMENEDKHRCQGTIDKLLGFVKDNGNSSQLKKALELQLPTGSVYHFLEGRLPHPSHTYTRIAEITEAEEKEQINKQIGERRTRLGARKDQVTTEVKREVYSKSQLEEIYENIINWTNDDDLRRQYEQKLLQRAYDKLLVLGQDKKKDHREKVMKLARGMVLIKHPFTLAWDIELEWADVDDIAEMDAGVLREYIMFFPERGLSSVLKGYLNSEVSRLPMPKPAAPGNPQDTSDDEDEGGVSLTGMSPLLSAEDRLIIMTDGLADAKQSALAHRLMGEYFAYIEEDESTVETVRNGLKLLESESKKSGLKFFNSFDAMNNTLATTLIRYQSPKNHPEAKAIFETILKRKPTFTPAMIGVGLILEEEGEYVQAIEYLKRALQKDPQNAKVGAELAWCKALNGDLSAGLKELEKYISTMTGDDLKARELRAETLYRIGKCQWEIDASRDNRKSRKGPYSQFLAAIKTNINYAPAYTALGIYYEDYANDKRRARQCFQKAFDLSGSEVLAAERLARSYASQADWDIVEIIAQRVVDSGRAQPAPGSNKKGSSWPYSALGVVQMNRQDYHHAIVSFLAALRISPDDYHSYIGLGECYHNSGRYNSSLRTFRYAEQPEDGVIMKKPGDAWFTTYMLANVNRELGNHDEAIEKYHAVLKHRPREFGVEIALLQTLLERGWRALETGFFGSVIDSASQAFDVATSVAEHSPNALNLWKAVADACSLHSYVQGRLDDFPATKVESLLRTSFDVKEFQLLAEIDDVGVSALEHLCQNSIGRAHQEHGQLTRCLEAAILAQKRAIHCSTHDIHAQAVAWYNLGWTEYRSYVCLVQGTATVNNATNPKKPVKFLKAAMRCFKRAIELEAGNADFWNALGVTTTQLNPKVAQHAFVRALRLNERKVEAWTNLGVLYLLQNDVELAHKAFTRAQSTDPDYAHAWIGEGWVALILGDVKEALLHFTHAFEISDASSSVAKREFATHSFDDLISSPTTLSSTLDLVRPLLALQQLHSLQGARQEFDHLSGLYNERAGSYNYAEEILAKLCDRLEEEYEVTESPRIIARLAKAKTDLARTELAVHDYESAANNADTALALTTTEDKTANDSMLIENRRKLRLSAHLTLGLAQYYREDMDAALEAFQAALKEGGAAPDVICLLAEVLWAKGGEEERNVAREQLLDCVQNHPEHVGAVVLLGVLALIDDDAETLEAVHEELEHMRTMDGIGERDADRVERVLEAMVQLSIGGDDEDFESLQLNEAQKSVMLFPWRPTGWAGLGDLASEPHPAEMALRTAERNVPPRGQLGAEDLGRALANTGAISDAQRAIVMSPWQDWGWKSMAHALSS